MNINSISSYPNIGAISTSAGQQQASVPQNLLGIFEDTQLTKLNLSDVVKSALTEMSKTIGQRDMLLQSLPTEIKEAVLTLIKENTVGVDNIAQGFTAMIKSQKQTADKLMTMSEMLGSAALYQLEGETMPSELTDKVLLFGLKGFENFVPQKVLPESDIMLLAEQLLSGNSVEIEDQSLVNIKQLLQQVFTGKDAESLTKEMANFRRLFSSLEQQIPQNVQQAAVTYNLPELADTYVLLKLRDIMQWKDMPSKVLRECAEKLHDLSMSMQKNLAANGGETTSNQSIATYNMSLYFDVSAQPYPLYIHIYSKQENKSAEYKEHEVWMRISLATENIGIVDVLLHLYGESQLSVKVDFSGSDYAKSFLEYVPNIRANMEDSPIKLVDINIRSSIND